MNQLGEEIVPLDEDRIKVLVDYFKKEGVDAIAVAYLHAYKNPAHEIRTVELINELWPEAAVTASHEVTKEWREYERTNTAVLNSYVKPIASSYIDRLNGRLSQLGTGDLRYIMQSNGGRQRLSKRKKPD